MQEITHNSVYNLLALPGEITTTITLTLLAFALAPWFAGRKIGTFEIPSVSKKIKRHGRWISPILVGVAILCFASIIPSKWGFPSRKPVLLYPANGSSFDNYPRTLDLKWKPMAGAYSYRVEVQVQNPSDGKWYPHPYLPTFASSNLMRIEFIGGQPGQWRVKGIAADGTESVFSDWWQFEFRR
jgi:hypothetical protein